MIGRLKERHAIAGRTVRVADKGPDCADNVADAVLSGDGYVFSRSVRTLPAKERAWALAETGWEDVVDDGGNLLLSYKEAAGDFEYRNSITFVVFGVEGMRLSIRLP